MSETERISFFVAGKTIVSTREASRLLRCSTYRTSYSSFTSLHRCLYRYSASSSRRSVRFCSNVDYSLAIDTREHDILQIRTYTYLPVDNARRKFRVAIARYQRARFPGINEKRCPATGVPLLLFRALPFARSWHNEKLSSWFNLAED